MPPPLHVHHLLALRLWYADEAAQGDPQEVQPHRQLLRRLSPHLLLLVLRAHAGRQRGAREEGADGAGAQRGGIQETRWDDLRSVGGASASGLGLGWTDGWTGWMDGFVEFGKAEICRKGGGNSGRGSGIVVTLISGRRRGGEWGGKGGEGIGCFPLVGWLHGSLFGSEEQGQ